MGNGIGIRHYAKNRWFMARNKQTARPRIRVMRCIVFSALLAISVLFVASGWASDSGVRRPVAELLGRSIYTDEHNCPNVEI